MLPVRLAASCARMMGRPPTATPDWCGAGAEPPDIPSPTKAIAATLHYSVRSEIYVRLTARNREA